MRLPIAAASIALAACFRTAAGLSLQLPRFGAWPFARTSSPSDGTDRISSGSNKIAPKVMIISMFEPESDIWYTNLPSTAHGTLFAHNITLPGLSPLYPDIHCTRNYEICQITVGEAEINTAASLTSLALSPLFSLRKTYFLIAGIAGISPKIGTQGSIAFSRYAVQVALQYEFDPREMPDNFSTGYFPYGTTGPGQYPTILYGTEVFEVNAALRDRCVQLASKAELATTPHHRAYGLRYPDGLGEGFAPAGRSPGVVKADSATSDVYFSGALLAEAFENTTALLTNGSGVYGVTAQEENASLAVLMRVALHGLVDFGRIVIMRAGSNFDRPPPGVSVYEHLVVLDQSGLGIATENLWRAGWEVVKGILERWECEFRKGIVARNYMGDVFGSLGGEPDFGPGSLTGGKGVRVA